MRRTQDTANKTVTVRIAVKSGEEAAARRPPGEKRRRESVRTAKHSRLKVKSWPRPTRPRRREKRSGRGSEGRRLKAKRRKARREPRRQGPKDEESSRCGSPGNRRRKPPHSSSPKYTRTPSPRSPSSSRYKNPEPGSATREDPLSTWAVGRRGRRTRRSSTAAVEEVRAITGQKPVVTRSKPRPSRASNAPRAGIPDRRDGDAPQGSHVGVPRPLGHARPPAHARLPRRLAEGVRRARGTTRSVSRSRSSSRRSITTASDVIKGLNISLVTTQRERMKRGARCLQHLGMPFRAAWYPQP